MSAQTRSMPAVFDKYMLPKVAFTLITFASMAGATLTALRLGVTSWSPIVLRWTLEWTLAALWGSLLWRAAYLAPSVKIRPMKGALDYAQAMLDLHRRWEQVLGTIVLVCGLGTFWYYKAALAVPTVTVGLGIAALVAGTLALSRRLGGCPDPKRADVSTVAALVAYGALVAVLATTDVTLQHPALIWPLALNRTLHLLAFSAWLGGALWNIFIAVPAGMARVSMDTVILANFQLERFRVVVRTVFPTIVFTGLVQAWAMFGWTWLPLYTTVWGYLVLFKLSLLVLLIGVFIACPMWAACSPIRGVCNLDDFADS